MGRSRLPRVWVYEVRVPGFVAVRRFLSQEEQRAFCEGKAGRGITCEARTVEATATQLWHWGLGEPPARELRPKRPRRTHPPRCPNCGSYWYGPGRPRKGQPRSLPSPRLVPAPSLDPFEGRPDLAGLFDPRLADDGEP